MRLVVALGGNALLRRGEKPDATVQLGHVRAAAAALAPLAADHDMVICHGNGPQVGMLALESDTDPLLTRGYPLDDLVAQTQGMIGYWLCQALVNAGLTKPVLGVISQTVVAIDDPALANPTKFIGPGYTKPEADQLAAARGWTVALDGEHWRRVVASPEPLRLVEAGSVTGLLDAGTVVVAGGGGGAVVAEAADGALTGVEAVVDKDLLSALLAITTHADRLLILTDVPAVMRDFETPQAHAIDHLSLEELSRTSWPAGSMAPKLEACRRFVARTGNPAVIGSLEDAAALLAGTAGTTVSG